MPVTAGSCILLLRVVIGVCCIIIHLKLAFAVWKPFANKKTQESRANCQRPDCQRSYLSAKRERTYSTSSVHSTYLRVKLYVHP